MMGLALKKERVVQLLLCLAVLLNLIFWLGARDLRAEWSAVPPAPGKTGIQSFALGDPQLAYRMIGLMLQNFGDTGGRSTALRDYDFGELSKWLFLSDALDSRSNFAPYLAAMYFGAVDDPSKLPPLLDYLEDIGQRPGKEHWRWLAHAAYLARFKMNDLDRALKYANKLAALPGDLPSWARQMPGFILNAKGNKDEALAVMVKILESDVENNAHPNEINHTLEVICTRILDPAEAAVHPLCKDYKPPE